MYIQSNQHILFSNLLNINKFLKVKISGTTFWILSGQIIIIIGRVLLSNYMMCDVHKYLCQTVTFNDMQIYADEVM